MPRLGPALPRYDLVPLTHSAKSRIVSSIDGKDVLQNEFRSTLQATSSGAKSRKCPPSTAERMEIHLLKPVGFLLRTRKK